VLIMGNRAGQQAVWTAPDGQLHIFFQFNDRGRGPQTTSILKLNASGLPVAESVQRQRLLKSKVNESYTLESGTARWKSSVEEGEKKLTAPAVYDSINGAPAELGILAQVALGNGGRIALLPDGEATIDRVAGLSLEIPGRKKNVILYAITGLDFAPTYVWLDERRGFFAKVDPWLTVIPEAGKARSSSCRPHRIRPRTPAAAALASKLSHPAPGGIVFTHVSLFDAQSAEILKDRTVVVAGNRIRSVGLRIRSPARRSAGDRWHGQDIAARPVGHACPRWGNDGLLNLAAGVTTVRDLGNDIDTLLARRKRIEEGQEIGTRIVLAGIIDGPGPYQGPTKVLVSTEDEARAAVDNYARLGYVQIKIYSSVKPELVPAIIHEAHKLGLRVSGHIPAEMTAAQCVELGYDEIQHANFLMLNFMPDVKNTNTPLASPRSAKRGADLDLNSPQVQSFIKLLQDHHTVLDPTLSIFEEMMTSPAGKIPRGYQPIAERLPPQVRRGLLSIGLTPPPGMEQRYQQSFTRMMEMIGMMYRAGIPMEDGTDSMAGFALHRELELDVQAGIPANKVLQDATLNAARIMKLDHDLGSIEPGKLADLTLLNGDPVENISDVRKTALVVKNGIIYKPQELYSALGVAP
jgi:hypothetical protein